VTLQKVQRKDVVPGMGELEAIVAVFEERSRRGGGDEPQLPWVFTH
jgi:hypothetical protein